MFVFLTPEFDTLVNLLPLPTISELLTECVVESELNMDSQEQWKSPSPVLLPVVQESSAWKLLEGTCQLVFCVTSPNHPNLYSVYEICNFMNGGQEPRTETTMSAKCTGRGGVNRTLCVLACTPQSCTVRIGARQSVSLMTVLWTLAQDRSRVSPVKMKAVSMRLVIASLS